MRRIQLLSFKLILGTLIFFSPVYLSGQNSAVKTLYFKSNSYKIDKKYLPILNKIGLKCSSSSFSYLKIFAYADKKGSKKYNEELSEKRAVEVYSYLIKNYNIDTTKVYVTWIGEEVEGAYDLHFPNAHVQQRCVDIIIDFKKPSD